MSPGWGSVGAPPQAVLSRAVPRLLWGTQGKSGRKRRCELQVASGGLGVCDHMATSWSGEAVPALERDPGVHIVSHPWVVVSSTWSPGACGKVDHARGTWGCVPVWHTPTLAPSWQSSLGHVLSTVPSSALLEASLRTNDPRMPLRHTGCACCLPKLVLMFLFKKKKMYLFGKQG